MKGYDKIKAEGGPFDSLILASAERNGVSYDLLHKQLFLESSFNPRAKSPTGPRGIGQFTAATGKAYGLITEDDFYDPAKSIEAAAQHMRDNIKTAKGDELKALLLYNQGGGRLGVPQLEAYDRGDFSGISDEGLKYMEKLRDVVSNGKALGVSQEAKPASSFEAPAGIESQPQVTTDYQPQRVSMQFTGEDPKAPNESWGKTLYDATGSTEEPEAGAFTGLGDATETGLKNSPLGVALRAALHDDNADFTQTFTMMRDVFNEPLDPRGRMSDWQDEDYEKLRNSELDPQFYDVVLRGYRRNFDNNLSLALENQALQRQAEQAGFGAQLLGGATEMAGDPYSLVNPGRAAGANVGSRLLGGAAVGSAVSGLSESQSARVSGREENMGMAIAGGAVFGSTLNGLLGARAGQGADLVATPRGDLRDWQAGNQSGYREDVPDSVLERILERHGEASEPNSFGGPSERLMAREKARLEGLEDDPTAIPYRAGEETVDGIVPYIDVPFDPSAARTLNGAIHSGGSPLNPKTIQQFTEMEAASVPKAQRGVSLGSITEVGYKLLRSENESIRSIGHNLFRSPTGLEDGSGGKYGPAAADVVERLSGTDNILYNKLSGSYREVLNDPWWKAQGGTKAGKMEAISRRVVEAMEDTSGATHRLTPGEQRMLQELKDHMSRKWSMIEDPGQFGNMNARSLLGSSRHEGSYFPQRYDRAAKHAMTEKLGGQDQLQEAIAQSWLASYMKRPAVKARVDRYIKDQIEKASTKNKKITATPEQIRAGVIKYANDKAYGVSHSDQFSRSTFLEENIADGIDLGANSYLEARNLFDSDVPVDLPDGSQFSVNDLREFDLLRVVPQYDRRVNGDIGIMAGTGKTTAELKQMADEIKGSAKRGNENVEAQALIDGLKLLTGRTRRDPDGAFGNLIRSLNDVGFMTKNAYMAPQNFTEAARLFVNGHQRMLLKGVPLLNKWTTAGSKLKPQDIKDMHSVLFGKELDDLIRPSRADIIDRMREVDVGDRMSAVVGSIKYTTGEMAVRSPFTWALRESSNYIADAGRQGLMTDLADLTLNGKATDLFTPGRLRSASVTPEQFEGVKALIRENFKRDKKGKWSLTDANALAADPRSMDLWRLADRVADEVILRPHKMSSQASKQYGAAATMALQFKMFVLRSLNGRSVRAWSEATKNQQALDETFTVMMSLGLATAFYAARAQVAAYGMPERKRQEYLDKALDPSMLTYAAISRSSHVGAPLGIANFIAAPLGFDAGAAVRSSILPREPKTYQDGRPMKYSATSAAPVQDFMSRSLEQVPGFQVLTAAGQAGYSAAHLYGGDRGTDEQGHRTGLWNALRQFVPNDPVSQNLMMRLAEDQGVDRAR